MTSFFVFVFKGESITAPIPEKAQRCKMLRQASVSADLDSAVCQRLLRPSPEIADNSEAPRGLQGTPSGVMCLFFRSYKCRKVRSDVSAALCLSAFD